MDDDSVTTMKSDTFVLDYRELGEEGVKEIRKVMKTFGLHMYSDPDAAGSDTWAFLVVNRQLKPKEVRSVFKQLKGR